MIFSYAGTPWVLTSLEAPRGYGGDRGSALFELFVVGQHQLSEGAPPFHFLVLFSNFQLVFLYIIDLFI